jgi:hypothetical protein
MDAAVSHDGVMSTVLVCVVIVYFLFVKAVFSGYYGGKQGQVIPTYLNHAIPP